MRIRIKNHGTGRWALLLPVLLLSACVKITAPVSGSTVNAAFTVSIGFRSQYCGGFKVTLDGADVTGRFASQPPATMTPTALFALPSNGPHTLVATASTMQYWAIVGSCASGSDTVTFNVVHHGHK